MAIGSLIRLIQLAQANLQDTLEAIDTWIESPNDETWEELLDQHFHISQVLVDQVQRVVEEFWTLVVEAKKKLPKEHNCKECNKEVK